MVVFIKENSRLAKMAAQRLHSLRVAMVVNNTVHLWGASREEFLQTPSWVRHEVAHVYQYKKYGIMRFLYLYLYQTFVNGYYNNRFEQEARDKETDSTILNGITFR